MIMMIAVMMVNVFAVQSQSVFKATVDETMLSYVWSRVVFQCGLQFYTITSKYPFLMSVP